MEQLKYLPDLLIEILHYVDVQDLLSWSTVSKNMYIYCNTTSVWRARVKTRFGDELINLYWLNSTVALKRYYFERLWLLKHYQDPIKKTSETTSNSSLTSAVPTPISQTIQTPQFTPTTTTTTTATTAPFTFEGEFEWRSADYRMKYSPAERFGHSGISLLKENKVYYIGGYDDIAGKPRLNEIVVYDGNTNSFELEKPLIGIPPNFARMASSLVENKEGKPQIWFFGGFDGLSEFFGLQMYDIQSKTWFRSKDIVQHGTCPTFRTNLSMCAIGSKLYLYGGNKDAARVYVVFEDFHEFDTETFTWRDLTPIMKGTPGKNIAHRLIAIGHRIFMVGGGLWFPPNAFWTEKFNRIWMFDTKTLEWTFIKSPNSSIFRNCTFSMPVAVSNFIFVYGGQDAATQSISNELLMFDTITFMWYRILPKFSPSNVLKARDIGTGNLLSNRIAFFAGSRAYAIRDMDFLLHPKLEKILNGPKQLLQFDQ